MAYHPKKVKLYAGGALRCPECGKPTPVRCHSVAHKLSGSWAATANLLVRLYETTLAHTEDGNVRTKVTEEATKSDGTPYTYKTWKIISAKTCRCVRCHDQVPDQAFWFSLSPEPRGQLPPNLGGPYCAGCLSHLVGKASHGDGTVLDFPVYSLSVTPNKLARISEVMASAAGTGFVSCELPEPELGVTVEQDVEADVLF